MGGQLCCATSLAMCRTNKISYAMFRYLGREGKGKESVITLTTLQDDVATLESKFYQAEGAIEDTAKRAPHDLGW